MDIGELIAYLMTPVAQIALVIAIAELAKGLGLPTKWIPVLDVVVGLLLAFLVYSSYYGYKIVETIMLGLAIGLSACGLFSGIKNLTEKKQ